MPFSIDVFDSIESSTVFVSLRPRNSWQGQFFLPYGMHIESDSTQWERSTQGWLPKSTVIDTIHNLPRRQVQCHEHTLTPIDPRWVLNKIHHLWNRTKYTRFETKPYWFTLVRKYHIQPLRHRRHCKSIGLQQRNQPSSSHYIANIAHNRLSKQSNSNFKIQ